MNRENNIKQIPFLIILEFVKQEDTCDQAKACYCEQWKRENYVYEDALLPGSDLDASQLHLPDLPLNEKAEVNDIHREEEQEAAE